MYFLFFYVYLSIYIERDGVRGEGAERERDQAGCMLTVEPNTGRARSHDHEIMT